jgi:hypothetical protein
MELFSNPCLCCAKTEPIYMHTRYHSTGQKAKKLSMIEFHIHELENRLGSFPNAPITPRVQGYSSGQ